MSPYGGRRVFRSPGWLYAVVGGVEAIFASGAWFHLRTQGWSPMTLAFIGLTVMGALGIVETAVQQVVLSDDAMHVIRWYGRGRYAKDQIVRISHGKGVGVSVQLADGRWVKLPGVAGHLPNSIRAWLRTRD
jgi:hypothetical protein